MKFKCLLASLIMVVTLAFGGSAKPVAADHSSNPCALHASRTQPIPSTPPFGTCYGRVWAYNCAQVAWYNKIFYGICGW